MKNRNLLKQLKKSEKLNDITKKMLIRQQMINQIKFYSDLLSKIILEETNVKK